MDPRAISSNVLPTRQGSLHKMKAPQGLRAGYAALGLAAGAALVHQQAAGGRALPRVAALLAVVAPAGQQLAAGGAARRRLLIAGQVGVHHLRNTHTPQPLRKWGLQPLSKETCLVPC